MLLDSPDTVLGSDLNPLQQTSLVNGLTESSVLAATVDSASDATLAIPPGTGFASPPVLTDQLATSFLAPLPDPLPATGSDPLTVTAEFIPPNPNPSSSLTGLTSLSALVLPDDTEPIMSLRLREDTGFNASDGITRNPDLLGKVTDTSKIAALMLGLGNQSLDQSVNILQFLKADGTFELTRKDLENLQQSPLADGNVTIQIVAIDEFNNISMPLSFSFTLAANSPEITQVYAVSADVLAIEINTGQAFHAEQIPYQPDPKDILVDQPYALWVEREGQYIGSLSGSDRKILYPFDRFSGTPLDLDWASRPQSFLISSSTDTRYQTLIPPEAVFRKSKPTDLAQTGNGEYQWPLRHTLYLDLPAPLTAGKTYDIQFPGSTFTPLTFTYQPEQQFSEAVHISQVGFRPDDPLKIGYLSTWMGDGGGLNYADRLTFWLIDEATGNKVYTSQTSQVREKEQIEDPRGRDHTLAEVHSLNFSDFTQPGRYRLCVDTIGCSLAFEIKETAWQEAFYVSARGFYHQRSGIEIGAPYSDYERPRAFHPDDGVVVYQSTTTLFETNNGIGNKDAFSALLQGKTDEVVANAWGGYFDAGDWDRRIQHLEVSRLLLELMELSPNYFATMNLNIPESQNTLPDTLDEALWSLDFFRRLQTANGGIRGGIESAEHPKRGETSWQESLTVMAYAPDMWSSYIYAGVAARAAHLLQSFDVNLATQYRESALRAMAYAEDEHAAALARGETLNFNINDERNLAALELFRLTGEESWHQLFLNTTAFKEAAVEAYVYDVRKQRDAAFLYARLDQPQINRQVQQYARTALLQEADIASDISYTSGFGWTKTHAFEPVGWAGGLGAPKTISLVRAHALTGNQTYLSQVLRGTQFSLGANPDNLVYTTGLGQRSVEHPLIVDQRISDIAAPPGITVYGPISFLEYPNYWLTPYLAEPTYPNPWTWPTVESFYDVYLFPAATEYTVMESMAPAAYTWGYLAARASTRPSVAITELPVPEPTPVPTPPVTELPSPELAVPTPTPVPTPPVTELPSPELAVPEPTSVPTSPVTELPISDLPVPTPTSVPTLPVTELPSPEIPVPEPTSVPTSLVMERPIPELPIAAPTPVPTPSVTELPIAELPVAVPIPS